MKKIIILILTFLSLASIVFIAKAANYEGLWTDAKGRIWDIKHSYVATTDGHYNMGIRMVEGTMAYLNANETINLGALDTILSDPYYTCDPSACNVGTVYPGSYTSTATNIVVGCTNIRLATFDLACPEVSPNFSCSDMQIKSGEEARKSKDASGTIVIYARNYIKIRYLKMTNAGESLCRPYGANKLKLTMTSSNGSAILNTNIAEKLVPSDINDLDRNLEIRDNLGSIITKEIGTYAMDFDFSKNSTFLQRVTCNLRIIADDLKNECGVDESGNWNGNGDEILDSAKEECDIKADGTKLGSWGDKTPGCNSCNSIKWCGDGVRNNYEECDYADSSYDNWGMDGCNSDCTRNNGTCGDGIKNGSEECDYEDSTKTGWGTLGCSAECTILGEQPDIEILKYSANPSDLDGVTNDSNDNDYQTIHQGNSAIFKIKVINTGKENLENIVLDDSLSSDCEGTLDFSTKKVGNNNITFGGTGDYDNSYLDIGENFEYTCNETSVQEGFENTIVVTANGKNSGTGTGTVTDNDNSYVMLDDKYSIEIVKYSSNQNDLDGNMDDLNETNDSQLVNSGDDAIFKIKVSNYGSGTIGNIKIEDIEEDSCATKNGTTVDLTNKTFTNKNDEIINITIYGDVNINNGLQPGEYFFYECNKTNTLSDYINTAKVIAEECTTLTGSVNNCDTYGSSLNYTDSTDILVLNCIIDGTKTDNEGCDPNDATQAGWGNAGCSNECIPINSGICNIDGIKQYYEACDPNDAAQIGWGTLGCSNECIPINSGICNIDGIKDAGENCDPNDATQIGWGTYGCDNNCNPIDTETCNSDGLKNTWELCDPNDTEPDSTPLEEGWGTGTPGCNSYCIPINSGSSSGGSGPSCKKIEIAKTTTDNTVLDTAITCYGNSKVKSFMLDCDDGSTQKFLSGSDYMGSKRAIFDSTNACSYNAVDGYSFTPKCYVSGIENNTDSSYTGWDTSLTNCQGGVTVGTEPPPCTGPNCSFIIDTCEELKNINGWDIDCNKTITEPDGWSYTRPTYANNDDKKMVCLRVLDQYNNEIELSYFNLMGNPGNTGDFHDNSNPPTIVDGLQLNQVDGSGGEGVEILRAAFIDSHICMLIKSKAPGKEQFDFNMWIPRHTDTWPLEWNGNYRNVSGRSSMDIEFLKPFVGKFEVTSSTGDKPKINTSQLYKVIAERVSDGICNNSNCNYSNGELNIKAQLHIDYQNASLASNRENNTVTSATINQVFDIFGNKDNSLGSCNYNSCSNFKGGFTARIDATTDDSALETPKISSQNMIIKYKLGGEEVKYYLTANDAGDDRTEFFIKGEADIQSLGLKILGTAQWVGKGDITGQDNNFSDLSKLTQKAKIKKNAYNLIKQRASDTIVNGVKYIKGNYSISNDPVDYETIIVENGNLTIDQDLSGKTIGIIVLNTERNYSKTNGLYNKGNVYVKPNVKKINALIYADGAFVSTDNTGDPYTENSTSRTSTLQEQLWLNGGIFSKNTIGGAVITTGLYKLPGGKTTTDFNEAMIYDLNYIRSGNNGSVSGYDAYSFIIKFDSNLQSNPPKGFDN